MLLTTQFKNYSITYTKDILVKVFYNKTLSTYTIVLFGFLKKVSFTFKDVFIITHDVERRILFFSVNTSYTDLHKLNILWRSYNIFLTQLFRDFIIGYDVILELRGVGFKAFVENDILLLSLGFSHKINYRIPQEVSIKIIDPKNTMFLISGFDRRKVHEIAARIRNYKKPDVYKGKGVCYRNEIVFIKESKKEQ